MFFWFNMQKLKLFKQRIKLLAIVAAYLVFNILPAFLKIVIGKLLSH